jgi:hypothetical protein
MSVELGTAEAAPISPGVSDARANATRIESAKETFLFYRNGRWLWVNVVALSAMLLVYLLNEPVGGNNGGTVFGYALGGLATAGILYLMWYGVRRRSYQASGTTLQGCLSAHVWLGVSLSIIVPLHSGFQFGVNVHTLAYVLMMFVVVSGVFGAVNYLRLAPLIAAHRGGGHAPQLLEQIGRLSKEINGLTSDRSDQFVALKDVADFALPANGSAGIWCCLRRALVPRFDRPMLENLVSKVPSSEQGESVKLLSLVARKRELAVRLQEDVRKLTLLKIWLWVHVPFSFALLFAVAIHIVIVFMYR